MANLWTFPEEFDNAAWTTKNNITISANAAVAPNGETTADKFVENTATAGHGIQDGQRKKVTMSNATNASTVTVTSHETSDPEVFTFNALTDVLILEWDAANAYWWTVKNIGVTT